jgi:phosphopantothenoylcysteine decarboxylase/phosphopantothenate--cysteine ligase
MRKEEIKVLLGVTGSIAAYKAVELVRLMIEKSWQVKVVMTYSATKFVGKTTFQTLSRNPVAIEMFPETDEWRPHHVSLGEWADIIVIAPCTANVIAKLAHGMADDLLSCSVLASSAPLVIAPAMNEKMWKHPATQSNVSLLISRGATIITPEVGELACGTGGPGRLASLETIMATIHSVYMKTKEQKK